MTKILKRISAILLIFALMAVFFAGCGKEEKEQITSFEQLDKKGVIIGVPTDCDDDKLVEEKFPNATVKHFNDDITGCLAVEGNKITAYVADADGLRVAMDNGVKGVTTLDETLGQRVSGVPVSPNTKIPDLKGKLDNFIDEIEENGIKADAEKRWLEDGVEEMPDVNLPEKSDTHLVIGTCGTYRPYSYYKEDNRLVGYDIELAYRFAEKIGATVEFKIYDWSGMIAALSVGEIDCIFADLYLTKEREESFEFSKPTHLGEIVVVVKDENNTGGTQKNEESTTKISDFGDKNLAILTGTSFNEIVSRTLPNANQLYFNSMPDMVAALDNGKVDGIVLDEPVARNICYEKDNVTIVDGGMEEFDYGLVFNKNARCEKICDELSEYLDQLRESGELEEIQKKWFDARPDPSLMDVDIDELEDKNGTFSMCCYPYSPFSIYGDEIVYGYEPDLVTKFAKEKGYNVEFEVVTCDGTIPAIASGKFDGGCLAAFITDERKESVNFTSPDYTGNVVILAKKDTAKKAVAFIDSIKNSFYKTFIYENSYKLFVQGILMTLIIVILSAIFGTLLGYIIFMACRHGNRIANGIAKVFNWIMACMPVVVLLMLLYYVIFAKINIEGAAVAVIAFTLTFGADVYVAAKTAVGTVDYGQTEAALALGYTDRKAFFRFVFPQAMPSFLPAYRGGLINLIKATSVVGYIAVQDLTKVGDIIRSKTYEAFFPLIAITIFYFLMAGLLVWIINAITKHIDPTRRYSKKILKGVETDDRD